MPDNEQENTFVLVFEASGSVGQGTSPIPLEDNKKEEES
jgi:hypothetical protein